MQIINKTTIKKKKSNKSHTKMVKFIEFQENAGGGAGEDSQLQVGDLVRVVGIVAPFALRGVSIRGKMVLSRNPGYKTV